MKKSSLHIVETNGNYSTNAITALAARFANITISELPFALQRKRFITDEEYPAAAVSVTLSVAMAFMANLSPENRSEVIEEFINSLAKSLRGSVRAQNLYDTTTEGQW
jgi:hypothetical protein